VSLRQNADLLKKSVPSRTDPQKKAGKPQLTMQKRLRWKKKKKRN
jgi:hypothetical protein